MRLDEMIYGGPNELLDQYVNAYGKDILERRISDSIPNGWIEIVIETFRQIKTLHPGTRITAIRMIPAPRYGRGSFKISFATPAGENPLQLPKLPRSLKWIAEQARRRALSTCAACGHPIGSLKSNNLCSLCACKIGVRYFQG